MGEPLHEKNMIIGFALVLAVIVIFLTGEWLGYKRGVREESERPRHLL